MDKLKKICAVEWCTKEVKRIGLCGSHAARMRRHGDPLAGGSYIVENPKCSVEGCERPYYGRGYCSLHLGRFKTYGDPTASTIHDPRPAIIEGNIAKIPLGRNAKDGYAIVDKEDAWVAEHHWIRTKKGPRCEGFYAYSVVDRTVPKPQPIGMHNFLMKTPQGMDTDHKDNDGLNNRRSNLRIVTRTVNNHNAKLRVTNTSGHKGVSWDKYAKAWRAYVGGTKTRKELGHFKNLEDAIKARKQAEEEYGLC